MADNWIKRLKKSASKYIKNRHSPAGKKYLQDKNKKLKEIKDTHLSKQSKKQLLWLNDEDYKRTMKILKERNKIFGDAQ